MTIGATLFDHVAGTPDRIALVCDDQALTWRAFAGAVLEAEREIEAETAGRPGGVALLMAPSPHFLARFQAAARLGREAQVLDPAWPAATVADVVAALRPAVVYADRPTPGAVLLDTRRPIDTAFASRDRGGRTPPAPASPFYVGFTSGSTGSPKGYRRSHRSWTESFAADAREFGVTARDVVLAPGAMTHSLFLYAAIHALQIGATLVISRAFRPDAALDATARHAVTVLYAAPTQLRLMLDVDAPPLQSVRQVLSSGAKWFADATQELRTRFPHARFAEFYGASELSYVTVRKHEEHCDESSVGRAFSGVRLAIRDAQGDALPPGDVGRVFVASPFLFDGYALGAATLLRHEDEMSVGDLGYLDAAGCLHLVGRENRMIVTSGKNVYPEEVERVLMTCPGVRAAAVLGVPDPRRGERLVAMIWPDPAHAVARRELSRHVRAHLSLAQNPRVFVTAREWRWTASGKTDFAAMRRLWDDGAWDLAPSEPSA